MTAREALDILVKNLKTIKDEHETLAKGYAGKMSSDSTKIPKVRGAVAPPKQAPTGPKPQLKGKSGMAAAFGSMDKAVDVEATPKVNTGKLEHLSHLKAALSLKRHNKTKEPIPSNSKEVTDKVIHTSMSKSDESPKTSNKVQKMMGCMKNKGK